MRIASNLVVGAAENVIFQNENDFFRNLGVPGDLRKIAAVMLPLGRAKISEEFRKFWQILLIF